MIETAIWLTRRCSLRIYWTVETGEKYRKYMGQYPVISISLNGMKQASYEDAFDKFKDIIISEFERHDNILSSDKLKTI